MLLMLIFQFMTYWPSPYFLLSYFTGIQSQQLSCLCHLESAIFCDLRKKIKQLYTVLIQSYAPAQIHCTGVHMQTVKSQLQLHIRNSKPCFMLDTRLRREIKILTGLGNCNILLTPLILQRCVYSWGMHEKNIILKTAVGFEYRGLNVIASHQHMYNCRHIICKRVVQFIQ